MTENLTGGCLNPDHRILREPRGSLGIHHSPQADWQERGGEVFLSMANGHSASNGWQPFWGGAPK